MCFLWPDRIRFVDTDASGRIHYSALFRHLEIAEIEFYRSLGFNLAALAASGLSIPRVHVEADYLAPLGHDDEIVIHVRVAEVGQSSLTLAFDVVRADGVPAAKGRYVAVCISLATGRSTPLPGAIREALAMAQAK